MSDKNKKTPIEESGDYDNFIGKFNHEEKPTDLSVYFGEIEKPEFSVHHWKKHWKGMPEFENDANKCYKKLIVNFKNEEDYKEFAKILGLELTEKTRYVYYPFQEKQNNLPKRWVDDSYE